MSTNTIIDTTIANIVDAASHINPSDTNIIARVIDTHFVLNAATDEDVSKLVSITGDQPKNITLVRQCEDGSVVSTNYCRWWSNGDNKYINRHLGKLSAIVCFGDNTFVDSTLYKNSPLYSHVISLSENYINEGMGYSAPVMITIDFTVKVGQFLLFSTGRNGVTYTSYDSIDDATQHLKDVCTDETDKYILCDLSKMTINTINDNQCMVCEMCADGEITCIY